MAGYLDQYGAGDEQRARKIKITILSVISGAVASCLLYFIFHNFSEEQQAKKFFELLEARNYQAAYELWGCTSAHPCDGYPMKSFMQDWGPPVNVQGFAVLDGESCGNNVIVDVDAGAAGDRKLWVGRDHLDIGFPPYEQCPQGNRIYNLFRNVKYKLHGRTYR